MHIFDIAILCVLIYSAIIKTTALMIWILHARELRKIKLLKLEELRNIRRYSQIIKDSLVEVEVMKTAEMIRDSNPGDIELRKTLRADKTAPPKSKR